MSWFFFACNKVNSFFPSTYFLPALLLSSQPELDSFFQTNSVEYLALIFEDSGSYVGREVTCWSISRDVACWEEVPTATRNWALSTLLHVISISPLLPAATFWGTALSLSPSPTCVCLGNPGLVAVWEDCSAQGPEHWGLSGHCTGRDRVSFLLPLLSWRKLHSTQSVSIHVAWNRKPQQWVLLNSILI